MLFLALTAALASAAEEAPAHYHPMEIARVSTEFARAAGGSADAFEARQEAARSLSRALTDYELALDLLGDGAPTADRDRHRELVRDYTRQFSVVESFSTAMMEDFDQVFVAAMERALAQLELGAVECRVPGAFGLGAIGLDPGFLPGGPPRGPELADGCPGEDVNARLAEVMDADPALRAAIDEILAVPWPDLALAPEPRPPLVLGDDGWSTTADGSWISTHRLFRRVVPEALAAIDREDEEARLPFEAAIEQGATPAELQRLLDDARQITATTAARRAALAEPILECAVERLERLEPEPITWCVQPPLLGGCVGEEVTISALETLLDDRRFVRRVGP